MNISEISIYRNNYANKSIQPNYDQRQGSSCVGNSVDSGRIGSVVASNGGDYTRRGKRDVILAVHRVRTNEIYMVPPIDVNGEYAYDTLLGYCVKLFGVSVRDVCALSVNVHGAYGGGGVGGVAGKASCVLIDSAVSMCVLVMVWPYDSTIITVHHSIVSHTSPITTSSIRNRGVLC